MLGCVMKCVCLLVFLMTATALCTASPALAQSRENGCVFPLIYDAQGLRHFHVYLYYGPLAPPMESQTDKGKKSAATKKEH